MALKRTLFSLLLVWTLLGCQAQPVTLVKPEVIRSFPHDERAFTQGLLIHNGHFFESTGLYGQSRLREVVPETGEVLREVTLAPEYFAEGLALVGDTLIQLTWREREALLYNLETFERTGSLTYAGEGWGLCYDGEALWMSDGSSTLTRRQPVTFEILGTVQVVQDTVPVELLNELECVGGYIYANVWQTDTIVKVDSKGRVVEEIDASSLLSDAERAQLTPDAVLNGIAYDPESETFFITGKLWPKVFEVKLGG